MRVVCASAARAARSITGKFLDERSPLPSFDHQNWPVGVMRVPYGNLVANLGHLNTVAGVAGEAALLPLGAGQVNLLHRLPHLLSQVAGSGVDERDRLIRRQGQRPQVLKDGREPGQVGVAL
jgi:hypothetical protein